MNFLDLYFDKTNYEFDSVHNRNNDIILLVEDESYIQIKFANDGQTFKIISHSNEDFLCYLEDEYLINEVYLTIKENYSVDNWLFILIQVIFDLTYMKDYPNIKKFIKKHIYQEELN